MLWATSACERSAPSAACLARSPDASARSLAAMACDAAVAAAVADASAEVADDLRRQMRLSGVLLGGAHRDASTAWSSGTYSSVSRSSQAP